ncbi:hypothetical protein ACS0Y6_38525, partial [Burkholderia gladioli]
DVVGSYGIVFNSNPNDVKSATLAGYPGSNNLKFLMCQKNISPTHVSNTVSSKDGNLLGIMTGNVYEIQDECSKMTQGSSGGPWLLRSKQKNMEQLIFGVNAKLVKTKADKWFLWGGDDAQNTGVFSPPLVGWTQTLYEGASGMTTIAY